MNLPKLIGALLNPDRAEIQRLVRAFPARMESDVLSFVPILPFADHDVLRRDGTRNRVDVLVSDFRNETLSVGDDVVEVPYRIYLNEPDDQLIQSLSAEQTTILHCIYLLHHDGFVRQKHLEGLAGVQG